MSRAGSSGGEALLDGVFAEPAPGWATFAAAQGRALTEVLTHPRR